MLKDKKRLYKIIAIVLTAILIPTGGFFTYRYLTKADNIDEKTELLSKLEDGEKEELNEDKEEEKEEKKEEEKKEDKKEENTNKVESKEKVSSSNQKKEVTTNVNKKATNKYEAKANNSKSNVKATNKTTTHKVAATQNSNVSAYNNGWVKDDEAVARARARLYARTHKNSSVAANTSNVSSGKKLIRKDPIYKESPNYVLAGSGKKFKKYKDWCAYSDKEDEKMLSGKAFDNGAGSYSVVSDTLIVGYKYKYSDGTTKIENLQTPINLGNGN